MVINCLWCCYYIPMLIFGDDDRDSDVDDIGDVKEMTSTMMMMMMMIMTMTNIKMIVMRWYHWKRVISLSTSYLHLFSSTTSGNQAFFGLMITCEMFSNSDLFQESRGSFQNCKNNNYIIDFYLLKTFAFHFPEVSYSGKNRSHLKNQVSLGKLSTSQVLPR